MRKRDMISGLNFPVRVFATLFVWAAGTLCRLNMSVLSLLGDF